jgi:type VI secretion system protein VasG
MRAGHRRPLAVDVMTTFVPMKLEKVSLGVERKFDLPLIRDDALIGELV